MKPDNHDAMKLPVYALAAAATAIATLLECGCDAQPAETISALGGDYRVVKRGEAMGAERWIFQRGDGTNYQVVGEAIVENNRLSAVMQPPTSFGCVPRVHSRYFRVRHTGGGVPLARVAVQGDRFFANDVPCSREAAAQVMAKSSGDFIGIIYFERDCDAARLLTQYAAMASNRPADVIIQVADGDFIERIPLRRSDASTGAASP